MRLTLIALAAAALLPASAAAAPAGFYGSNWDRQIARGGTGNVSPQFATMRRVGVQTVRTVFRWAEMEAARSGPIYFAETDVIVETAVRNGFGVLPVVMTTPEWARKYPGRGGSPPADADDFGRFLARLAARYGEQGTFWIEHPELAKRPLRHWQIWNEPELRAYWSEPKFWVGYARLVRAADRALEGVDPRAKVVLAGSVGFSWESLDRLYRQGVKGHFDVAAIHPYTGSPAEVAEIVRRNRRVLSRHGEPHKPLWITELSWPAAKGRMKPPSGLKRVVTDDRGMARRLTRAYRYFARPPDRRHRVGRVYWYTWASSYRGRGDVFDYAGLLRFRHGKVRRTRAWYAFRRVASR
jgi:hypothetical protein